MRACMCVKDEITHTEYETKFHVPAQLFSHDVTHIFSGESDYVRLYRETKRHGQCLRKIDINKLD